MKVRITRDCFDNPNHDRIPGLDYSQKHRRVFVPTALGLVAAHIGDWVVRHEDGRFEVYGEEDCAALFGKERA